MSITRLPHSLHIILRGFTHYKKTLFFLICLGFLGGIFETIGINTLIPLFGFVLNDAPKEMNALTHVVQEIFHLFHLNFSVESLLFFVSFVFIAKAVMLFLFQLLHGNIIANYEFAERSRALRKTLEAEWPFLLKQKIGHLDKILTQDITNATFVLRDVGQVILVLTNLSIYIVFAIMISPVITITTLIISTVFFLAFKPLFRKTSKTARAYGNENKSVAHFVNQMLLGIKSIKTRASIPLVMNKGNQLFAELKVTRTKLYLYSNLGNIFAQPVNVIFLLILFFAFYHAPNFNFAVFTVTIYLVQKIFVYVQNLQKKIQTISENIPYLEASITDTSEATKHKEISTGNQPFVLNNELTFQDINFHYEDSTDILKEFCLSVHKGEMIGIVGTSGSGKTTFIDLLLRLFKPSSGSILLDGQNIETIHMEAWRKNVAYVPQDVFLLNDTIEANVRFFNETASKQDIERAVSMSFMDEFVAKEPLGLNTEVGERGLKLSAGQRQRIVLARALLQHPKILVLDEATSALDHESEAGIQKVLKELKGKMTIIIIAHRHSALTNADRIATIEDGKIRELGTPDTLQKNPSSFYSKMQETR